VDKTEDNPVKSTWIGQEQHVDNWRKCNIAVELSTASMRETLARPQVKMNKSFCFINGLKLLPTEQAFSNYYD